MTILTIMVANSKESRVLYSSKNDANILNSIPGMKKFVENIRSFDIVKDLDKTSHFFK